MELNENEMHELKKLFSLMDYDFKKVRSHEGGINLIYICSNGKKEKYVLRISLCGDREEKDYIAETEFVHYLKKGDAPVVDVLPSINGRFVEKFMWEGMEAYASLFTYAKGMLLADNGYSYRENAPLEEYFFNTGKALGKIHKLSKEYKPNVKRQDYFDKYNMDYIDFLIPDEFSDLKNAILKRIELFKKLPINEEIYGLVHFDFNDGNYHIDMENGDITVFDFDNCLNCWYMFDLATLWINGTGWLYFEKNKERRKEFMDSYFDIVLKGYCSETSISKELLQQLPLFIDMVLIENIVDEFECAFKEDEEIDLDDIEESECLIDDVPYMGFC